MKLHICLCRGVQGLEFSFGDQASESIICVKLPPNILDWDQVIKSQILISLFCCFFNDGADVYEMF